MNLLRTVRASAATLAALLLCSCAQPGFVPPVSEPSSSASRIRVVNDSTEELRDLHLLFPQDELAVGDVAAGAASGYIEVPKGVYSYSAFRFLRGGESVVQPVTDFVGETPLPIGDYTYVLGVDSDRGYRLELLTVLRAGPAAEGTRDSVSFAARNCVLAPPADAALARGSGLASLPSGCLALLAAGWVWAGCEVAA